MTERPIGIGSKPQPYPRLAADNLKLEDEALAGPEPHTGRMPASARAKDALPRTYRKPYYTSGTGSGGGDEMERRLQDIEKQLTVAAIDLGFIKGRVEDAPSKDWVNGKLSVQTTILISVMALLFTLSGLILTAVLSK